MQHTGRRFIFSVQGWKHRTEQLKKLQDFYSGSNVHCRGIPGEDSDYRFICPFLWVTLKMLRESWREKQLHF